MTKKDKRVNFLLIIPLLLAVLLFIGATYALYEKTIVPNKTITLTSGSKYISLLTLGDIDRDRILLNNTYEFALLNVGVEDAGFELYFEENDSNIDLSQVTYQLKGDGLGDVKTGTLSSLNDKMLLNGELVVGEGYEFSLTLQSNYVNGESIRVYAKTLNNNILNKNIKAGYEYASGSCMTGEESSCNNYKNICYKYKFPGACEAGTIIDYAVNDDQIVKFHVLFDNGDTMVMQSQENVVYNTQWISMDDYINAGGTESDYGKFDSSNKGPLTVLSKLENATSGWTNVNNQTYTAGTTVLYNNKYTNCDESLSCINNSYTLASRTTKARMITMQEAVALGCTNSSGSCPDWITPSIDEGEYFTMSTQLGRPIFIDINSSFYLGTFIGFSSARAVVVVSK